MKFFYIILIVSLFIGCNSKSSTSTPDTNVTSKTNNETPTDAPTKFGLASEAISKINQEMGLGSLLPWENDAGPGEKPYWFTTLEYEVDDPNRSIENLNNVIELSIGSNGTSGQYVDYFRINVLFMNPKDKERAKKLYLEKVTLLENLFEIPIPNEITTALNKETNLKLSNAGYDYEIEEYGASRRSLSLTIR